jgi:transposase
MANLAYRRLYEMNKVEARKELIKTYQETGSISVTARMWNTSRQVVRKWVRRYQAQKEEGLKDKSRRPHHSPRQTPEEIEKWVVEARKKTSLGRRRLAIYLSRQGVKISPNTIRHILRRHGYQSQKKRRYNVYPATWPWETEEPFSNIQSDVKHIYDKGSLGTTHTTHLSRHHLPRYQWTACDSRARLRFLAYSYSLDSTCGLAFLLLVLLWLRSFSVDCPVVFQTDWGVEFGGDNPRNVEEWNERFLTPLGGALKRYPKGRKGDNGRVERSHRTDDEEFYGPYLLLARNVEEFLALSTRWVYVYNVLRPHMGVGMGGKPPLTVLKDLGYNGNEAIALFPPIILDWISADLILSCDKEVGNNLLAHYSPGLSARRAVIGSTPAATSPPCNGSPHD